MFNKMEKIILSTEKESLLYLGVSVITLNYKQDLSNLRTPHVLYKINSLNNLKSIEEDFIFY